MSFFTSDCNVVTVGGATLASTGSTLLASRPNIRACAGAWRPEKCIVGRGFQLDSVAVAYVWHAKCVVNMHVGVDKLSDVEFLFLDKESRTASSIG